MGTASPDPADLTGLQQGRAEAASQALERLAPAVYGELCHISFRRNRTQLRRGSSRGEEEHAPGSLEED